MADSSADTTDGDLARARATAESRQWATALESFSRADAERELSPEDLEVYGTAAYLVGRSAAAFDALTRSHRGFLETDRSVEAVRTGIWAIFMLLGDGELAQAGGWIARLEHIVDRLPSSTAERGYMAVLEAFRLLAIEHRPADARTAAETATDLGYEAGDEDVVAMGLTIGGRALIYAGEPGLGLVRLDEAMTAVVSGVLSPLVSGTVYCSLIEACEEIGELRRATEWTRALDRWCDRQEGMVTFTGQCLTHRARVQRRRGNLDNALDEARRACERFVGAADESATGAAIYELAEIHRLRGATRAAEDAYRRAAEWGHDPQPGLALLRLTQGETAAAENAMRRMLTEASDPVARLRLLPAHVEVMLAAGDTAAARDSARELTSLAERYDTDSLRADAAMAKGAVALELGDARDALTALRSAEEHWSDLDAPYETARARALIGRVCELLGDDDTAHMMREAARRTFVELGTPVILPGLDTSATQFDHGLTERELEVLGLVATGMTNQAIGQELHLATKTVDRHVGNILTKLGVSSRTAATAFAYENDLL